MKTKVILASVFLLAASASALPDYEPFADSTGSGGTSYSTGANLVGQTNASSQAWFQAGPASATQPTVAAGDLSVPGLYSAGGGQSAAFGGNGESARLDLSVGAGGILSGTIYYSFAMKLTDLNSLNTAGVFWAGFNTAQGSQTTTPNTVATRVVTRSAGAGLYNIGLDKASGTTGSFLWAPGNFTTSDTIFLVGSYTFNTGSTTDDISQLWVNPDFSTFDAASAPGGSLSSTAGTDLARVASFVLYDRNANEPVGGLIDDLRFGTSWADVTPAAVPEPSPFCFAALGLAGVCLRLRRK
jgi:hypothetical protein